MGNFKWRRSKTGEDLRRVTKTEMPSYHKYLFHGTHNRLGFGEEVIVLK